MLLEKERSDGTLSLKLFYNVKRFAVLTNPQLKKSATSKNEEKCLLDAIIFILFVKILSAVLVVCEDLRNHKVNIVHGDFW